MGEEQNTNPNFALPGESGENILCGYPELQKKDI
jgi:hypothetical protein